MAWLKTISILSVIFYAHLSLALPQENNDPNISCVCYPKLDLVLKNFPFTEEQKPKVDTLYQEYIQEKNLLRDKFKSVSQDINAMSHQASIDDSKLNDLVLQKASIIAAKIKLQVLFKNKMYQIMTPLQQQQWDSLLNR